MLKTVQTVDEIYYVSWCEVGVNGDTLLVIPKHNMGILKA